MTCKDVCIHCDVCPLANIDDYLNEKILASDCPNFKPKSRFVELPCEVGQKVYSEFEGKIYEGKIRSFSLQDDGTLWVYIRYYGGLSYYWHAIEDLGKTVFLSREDAEKALAERSKE